MTMKNKELKVHNKLKDLRKQHKLSQEDVADALGLSRQSVIALEQEKYMPSLPIVASLCNLFDSAFEDIFEFEREIDQIFEKHFDQPINIINSREAKMPSELEPWRPFREAVSLRDAMDRLFEDSVITPKNLGQVPKIDIKETKDSVIVKAELPGIEEDKVEVEIMDNVMTISGEKAEEKVEDEAGYYYKESHSGSFARSFSLPADVLAEKASADMENGVLTISVPKVAPKIAKKISIKAKNKK
jgi:HSP20 family protein